MADDALGVADLRWFKPEPEQAAFINDRSSESFFVGGVGSGKTIAGAFKALTVSLQHPGTRGMVCRQTEDTLRDTAQKVLLDGDDKPPVIPPGLIRERSEGENSVTLQNGTEILFRSYQDWSPQKLLSLNLGWLWIEEAFECTENIWSTLLGRLRHPAGPRIAWGTSNPNGHDWIWGRAHPDAGRVEATLFEARTEANPHLPPDYIRRMRGMPKSWQKRWVDASFDTMHGQIWDSWWSAIHTYDPSIVRLPEDWRRIEALDHGTRNPTCVLWAKVDRDGNVWVFDEYYEPGIVSAHAEAILQRPRTGVIKADPSIFTRGPDGVSVADLYERAGIRTRPAVNDVSAGLLRVAEYLEPQDAQIFPLEHPGAGTPGAPRVFVSRACENLIREIPRYQWRDLGTAASRNQDESEAPRKKDDHACDAFRYLLADLPRPTRDVDTAALVEREARAPERRSQSAGVLTTRF